MTTRRHPHYRQNEAYSQSGSWVPVRTPSTRVGRLSRAAPDVHVRPPVPDASGFAKSANRGLDPSFAAFAKLVPVPRFAPCGLQVFQPLPPPPPPAQDL